MEVLNRNERKNSFLRTLGIFGILAALLVTVAFSMKTAYANIGETGIESAITEYKTGKKNFEQLSDSLYIEIDSLRVGADRCKIELKRSQSIVDCKSDLSDLNREFAALKKSRKRLYDKIAPLKKQLADCGKEE